MSAAPKGRNDQRKDHLTQLKATANLQTDATYMSKVTKHDSGQNPRKSYCCVTPNTTPTQ